MSTTLTEPKLWYADPLSCLYSTFATVLLNRGIDPLTCLGRNCRFDLDVSDDPSEEFYRVARSPDGILADIAPDLGFSSTWQRAEDIDALAEARSAHGTVIAAVDNYHLPFRPAYHDVHAAHLVTVLDSRQGAAGREFMVADAQPPAFVGWLAAEHLAAAVFSANPPDAQDAFFSDTPIAGRYLTFVTETSVDLEGEDLVARAVRANVESWESDGAQLTGRPAIEALLKLLEGASVAPLRSLYTLGWSPQAESYLHARYLERRAVRTQDFLLRDIARASRDVALAWTDMRLIGAYPPHPARLAQTIRRNGARLRDAYQSVADLSSDWLTQKEGPL